MIQKKIICSLCKVALGITIGAFSFIGVGIKGHASDTASYTTTTNEDSDTYIQNKITTETTKSEIEKMVNSGTFESSTLNGQQIDYIYSLYDNDPETIIQLQKQSDYNKGMPEMYSSYIHSSMFNGYDIYNGIDVSEWNGTIDWEKVKASGVDFAIIRVGGRYYGSGEYFVDDTYRENIKGALNAGLDVGVYFFSAAINVNEATREAKYTMNLIKGYNITLPVVMDYEYGPGPSGRLYEANLSKTAATKVVNAFCSSVEKNGYVGMIYASKSVLADAMNSVSIAKKYPVWNAQYNTEDTLTSKHSYWQYSSTGKVPGIDAATDLNFRYVKRPATVTNVQSVPTDSSVTLSWSKVPEAYGYQIVRYDTTQNKYVIIGSVKGAGITTFKDIGLYDGTTYKYRVRAYYKLKTGNKFGNYSSELSTTTISDQVKNVKVAAQKSNSIKITWTEKGSVSGYRILRAGGENSKYTVVRDIKNPATNSYTDKKLLSGTRYKYKVQAYTINMDGITNYHDASVSATGTTLPGKVSGVQMTATSSDSISLTWNKQLNVLGYKVYRLNTSTKKYKRIATLKGAGRNKYKDTGLKSNKKYTYVVRAYYASGKKTRHTAASDAFSTYSGIKPVSGLRISNQTNTALTLTWSKNNSASGYKLYMYDANQKKNVLLKNITSPAECSYTLYNLSAGTNYNFTIKSYKKRSDEYYYGSGCTAKTCTQPVPPSDVSCKSYRTNTLLSWNRVNNADGYMIYRYNKECTKRTLVATVKSPNTTTYVVPTISNGDTYRLVSYKNSGSKKTASKRSLAPVSIQKSLTGIITGDIVNVRKNSGTNYAIITEVNKNTNVSITDIKLADGATWYKIRFKNTDGKAVSGYVSGAYVKLK